MISVLCPSRLRCGEIIASVSGLVALAEKPLDIEILVAVDPDDPSDYEALTGPWRQTYVQRVPERYGYRQLHLYYNLLADIAQGDWLLLWNDDAVMTTTGWDAIVARYLPNVVLSPHNPHDPIPAFPIIPKRFVDALGHFSLGPHNDIWWQDIASALGILQWIDVHVEHHRPDLTGQPADSVHNERGHWLQQQYDELGPELQQDIEVIRSLLAGQ